MKRDVIFENDEQKLVRFAYPIGIAQVYNIDTGQLDKALLQTIHIAMNTAISKEVGRLSYHELSDHTDWFAKTVVRWILISKI